MKDVFEGSLAGTEQLLRNQLQGAKDEGRDVQVICHLPLLLILLVDFERICCLLHFS